MQVQFRPHHFLCAFCFRGRGYSPAFITNFQTIMALLNALDGDATNIDIVNHTDSICAPCPSRRNQLCESQTKIAALDQAHSQALELDSITSITWQEAKQRIADNITLETFHRICAGCEWKAYGICENVLREQGIIHEKI